MTITNYIIFHVACGILAYGAAFANAQRRFPELAAEEYRTDMAHSAFVGMFGPIGLFTMLFCSGFFEFGFKYK